MRDAFLFGVIVAVSCTIAATIGVGALVVSGHATGQQMVANWWTWWLGDVGGCTVVAPVLLALVRYRPVCWSRTRGLECGALLLLLIVVSQCVFGTWLPEELADGLSYLSMILLFWALLRFGIIEVSASILLLAVFAVWGTWLRAGPFATEQVQHALFDLQVFMNLYAITGLALAGLVVKGRETEANRALLAAAVESAGEAILISDAEGTIQYVNPAFEQLNHYSSSEVLGDNPRILRSNTTDRSVHSQMWESISRGETWRGSFQNRKRDGSLYDVEQTIAPVSDSEGKIINYVSVARDVTDRNRAAALRAGIRCILMRVFADESSLLRELRERGRRPGLPF